MGWSGIWDRVVFVGAICVTVAATLMVYAQDRVFDAESFSTTVAATLDDPAINEYLSEEISDALIDEVPDLGIGGPLLADVTGFVLESDVARRVVEVAARQAHEAIFTGGEDTLVLELSDLVVSIDQALAAISPDLSGAIPDDVRSLSVDLSSGELTAETVRLAERARLITVVLVAFAVVLLIVLVVVEPTWFRGLSRMGFALGVAGLVVVIARGVGESVVRSYGSSELQSDSLAAAWNLVLGDLSVWGWVLVACGIGLAGVGWAALHADHVDGAVRAVVDRLVAEPDSTPMLVARYVALLAIAVWALFDPMELLAAAIRCGGFVLGVLVIAKVLDRTGLARRLARLRPDEADEVVSIGAIGARAVLPIVVLTLLATIGVLVLSRDDGTSALFDPDGCNGHVELCDRRLDEVAMAASHNAMSSTATGFLLPNHLSTMRAQLDAGVRGLMIDTWYGRGSTDGTVRTSFAPGDPDSLDPTTIAAADAVRARQEGALGPERMFLCHSFCEIGALDAAESLREIREWLDDHPREVLVFVVQDATRPDDTAAIFERAGFAPLVHTQRFGEPFPTLGEMIESGRRVFVMVEADGEGVDWLHQAFEFSQETPFSFGSAEEFSCAPNRGRDDSPLFVVNHFITFARPGNQDINDRDPLLERAEACRDERGLQPNLIAVDYATRGDVMEVVDILNEVG